MNRTGKSGRLTRIHRRGPAALALALAAVALASATGRAEDRLVLLDGTTMSGRILAIAGGRVTLAGRAGPMDLDDLWRIERLPPSEGDDASAVVHLADGGRLLAREIALAGETCRIAWAHGALRLPVGTVAGIRFAGKDVADAPEAAETFARALRERADGRDRIVALAGEGPLIVPGALQEIRARGLVFVWDGKPRTVARSRIVGVALATTAAPPAAGREPRPAEGQPPDRTGWALAHLDDGSAVWGCDLALARGAFTMTLAGGRAVRLPWSAVHRLLLPSRRVVFVSDLEPAAVVERALVTFPWRWRRDRSVLGRPLTLGRTVYEKGLGVHALCRLTYALDGGYDLFAATLGLDAETGGRGDCVFVVLADGRELLRRRVRGAEAPVPVRVPVAGVRRLTLAVEAGENLDLADHADWCDARLIRKR